ncbi:MAG TPA: TetR/AcrR family transcriptional regulator [Desulfomonilia bacterium]|nr:TetR/AcrR family transcriptional regulator [Desulfomonilia bacterium]
MRRAQKREIKVETIYKAALKVFAEYGFKKATIGDIAAELGTAKSTLYFYIKDKRELYDKAVACGFRHWQDKVRDAIAAEKEAERQFLVMARKAYEYLAGDRHLRSILMRDPSLFPLHPAQDPYSEINRDSIALLTSILEKGIREGCFRPVNVAAVAPLMFSFYVLLIQRTYMFPDEEHQIMFEDGIDLILSGLKIREKQSRE